MAALGKQVGVLFHECLDPRRAVVGERVGELQALGLLDKRNRPLHIADGERLAGTEQQSVALGFRRRGGHFTCREL